MKKIVIVGGGPAGLFCAYLLLKKGFKVELYDQSTGLAKKFLVAGNGGLNLTHSEDLDRFASRYGKDQDLFARLIREFTPDDLRSFCSELGVETFVGSSGRVFPKKLKAAEILMNWSKELKSNPNFQLRMKHSLRRVSKEKELLFASPEGEVRVNAAIVVLAMGGASWKKTGSDGKWRDILEKIGVRVEPFRPMNCGFETAWSDHFIEKVDRAPLKNIALSLGPRSVRGEAMLTPFGIEGGGVYALSNLIRDEIDKAGEATIFLDLKPDLSPEQVDKKVRARRAKESMSNHLRKALGLSKAENTLLKEVLTKEDYLNSEVLSKWIKALPVKLNSARPVEEAISSSGGVNLTELDEFFQIKSLPGVYVAGEMMDWEAPTGGYLLQGCFSTAFRVVAGISKV